MWFLHERGYSFFEIPKLTYPEINLLIEESNEIQKIQAREHRKAKRRR